MKAKNVIKSFLIILSTILSLAVLISFDYIFIYQMQQGEFLLFLQLFILVAGSLVYIFNKKSHIVWLAVFSCYIISSVYASLMFFTDLGNLNSCGQFCFASDLIIVQYLFFMPVLSIPLFNLVIDGSGDPQEWRDRYKVVVILTYLILLTAIYLHFRG